MKTRLLFAMCLLLFFACRITPCAPIYSQGFNDPTLPPDWATDIVTVAGTTLPSVSNVTVSARPAGFGPYEGARFIRFNSYSCSSGSSLRLKLTNGFSTVGLTGIAVNFAWFEDKGFLTSLDYVTVQWSTNGTDWGSITNYARPNAATNAWFVKQCFLPPAAENQPSMFIAFLFTSFFGNDCHLDDVTVAQPSGALNLTPAQQSGAGYPGTQVPYTLTVQNLMGSPADVRLSYSNDVFAASGPGHTGVLPNGVSTGMQVYVALPTNALNGEAHTSVVTAVAGSYTNSALLITRCQWYVLDTPLYRQSFDAAWPPLGWTLYQQADSNTGWTTATPGADGTGKCAYHNFTASTIMADDWLVSAPLNLNTAGFDAVVLGFMNKIVYPTYYFTSTVLISTGNFHPASNEYTELLEIGKLDIAWTVREINLSNYVGRNPVYFAFRYRGADAHRWYVDDLGLYGRNVRSSSGIDNAVLAGPATIVTACCYYPMVYGSLRIAGKTGAAGPASNITAQLGWGPVGSSPAASSWRWVTAMYLGPAGTTNDLFGTNIYETGSGAYDYAYRFKNGDGPWVYADLDGSLNGYASSSAGKLTKLPCPPVGTMMYEQPLYTGIGVIPGGFASLNDSNNTGFGIWAADDFTPVSNAYICSIRFAGIYYGGTYNRLGTERGFWLYFYDNAPPDATQGFNHPGTQLYSTYYPGRACEEWLGSPSGYNLYRYTMNLPAPVNVLAGSTYWWCVQMDVDSAAFSTWGVVCPTNGTRGTAAEQLGMYWFGDNYWHTNVYNQDLGVELYGLIPEPCLAVIAAGAALCLIAARRIRR